MDTINNRHLVINAMWLIMNGNKFLMTFLSRESENSEDVSLKKQVIACASIPHPFTHTRLLLTSNESLSQADRNVHQTVCEELWTISNSQVNQAADKLKSVIAPFVESSKTMAINISDQVTLVLSDLFPLAFHLITHNSPFRVTKRAGDPPQGLCLKWWRRSPNYSPTSTCNINNIIWTCQEGVL